MFATRQTNQRALSILATIVVAASSFALLAAALYAQSDPRDPTPAQTSQPSAAPAAPASARPEPVEPRREPSASEILDALSSQKRGEFRPVVRPTLPGRATRTELAPEGRPRDAVVPADTRLLPDGYRLVDRPGRMQREGDFWVFSFESRSTQKAEPPIRLLPNRYLEDMEIASAGGTRPVVFLVSGDVTEYHGVNYLLVQKLLLRPDLGNLK